MKSFIVNEQRVEVIRQILDYSIAGMGQRKIASLLNEAKVEPFTKKGMWNSTYIRELIKNRALLGEFQPKHKGEPIGKVIPDYYPAVVSEELFYRAQTASAKRLSPSSAGRRGPVFSNLFTGMCKCGHCGGTFRLIKTKDTAYLTCSNNYMKAGCECSTRWKYEFTEKTILMSLSSAVDWFSTVDTSQNSRQQLEEQVSALKGKFAEKQKMVHRFGELFTMANDSVLEDARSRYVKAMEEETATKVELEQATKRLASYTPQSVRDELLTKSLTRLRAETDPSKVYELRVRVNAQLKEAGVILTFDEHEVSFSTDCFPEKTQIVEYDSLEFAFCISETFAQSIVQSGEKKYTQQNS